MINDELLDLCTCLATETFEDVKYGSKLSFDQVSEARLVKEFDCVFTDLPGTTNLTEHRIRLTADLPVRGKPYVVPYSVRKSLQEDIQRMIDMNVIRPSESPYSSPVVAVRKRDGTNRICIDYRRLNRITLPDSEPMTSMLALTQNFGKSKYFSKLDLSKGYWQIPVAKEDVYKTAFVTPDGCYLVQLWCEPRGSFSRGWPQLTHTWTIESFMPLHGRNIWSLFEKRWTGLRRQG